MEGASVQKDIDGLQAWNTPVLSGLSGCWGSSDLFRSTKKPDKPDRPTEQNRLADVFGILL
jgi:hypothetical protein